MSKVWVVSRADITFERLEVFDNEVDAHTFALEMESGGQGGYQIIETPVNQRAEPIAGEPLWTDFTNLNSQCIECLLEDFGTMAGRPIDEKACAEFLEQHKAELQKKSGEIVQEYLKKTICEYLDDEGRA